MRFKRDGQGPSPSESRRPKNTLIRDISTHLAIRRNRDDAQMRGPSPERQRGPKAEPYLHKTQVHSFGYIEESRGGWHANSKAKGPSIPSPGSYPHILQFTGIDIQLEYKRLSPDLLRVRMVEAYLYQGQIHTSCDVQESRW